MDGSKIHLSIKKLGDGASSDTDNDFFGLLRITYFFVSRIHGMPFTVHGFQLNHNHVSQGTPLYVRLTNALVPDQVWRRTKSAIRN